MLKKMPMVVLAVMLLMVFCFPAAAAEQGEGMTPEDVLAKSLAAVQNMNSCKVQGDVQVTMDMSGSSIPGSSTPLPVTTVNEAISGSISQKPLLIDMMVVINVPEVQAAGTQTMEMFMNDQGMFMKMPDGVWIKMDMAGIDYQALLKQQSQYQDVQFLLAQMKQYGVNLAFNNDQNNCWVVSASIGPDAFRQLYQSMMSNMPSSLMPGGTGSGQSLQQLMNTVGQNMQVDVVMNMFIDKNSFLLTRVEGNLNMNLSMPIPASGTSTAAGQLNMKMNEKINYLVSDYGSPVTAPDVSQAISFSDYLQKVMASVPK